MKGDLAKSTSAFLVLFLAYSVFTYYYSGRYRYLNLWSGVWSSSEQVQCVSTRESPVFQSQASLGLGICTTEICTWNKGASLTEKYSMKSIPWFIKCSYTDLFKRPFYLFFGLPRIRRCKRPCSYYPNTTASFHVQLIGDLVYKLNPGPVGLADKVLRSTIHRQWNCSTGTITSMRNIINTIISPVAASRRVFKHRSIWRNTNNLVTIRHVAGTTYLQKQMVVL